jgi:hypothetical protein
LRRKNRNKAEPTPANANVGGSGMTLMENAGIPLPKALI